MFFSSGDAFFTLVGPFDLNLYIMEKAASGRGDVFVQVYFRRVINYVHYWGPFDLNFYMM